MAPPRRLLAAIAMVALISAGCSNAPADTGSGGGGGDAGPLADAGGAAAESSPNPLLIAKSFEFAKCMRENGVEDYPDPGADGTILYDGDPDPAEFESAQENCRDILPGEGNRTPGGGG
jgi:nitrous oxide reductase accessory protein NosL